MENSSVIPTNGNIGKLPTDKNEYGSPSLEFVLDGQNVSVDDIFKICKGNFAVKIAEEARERVRTSRKMLEELVTKEPIYGVTTGYGALVSYNFIYFL